MIKEPLASYFQKGLVEAGVDEAGRGCLAGDVFAAAVILPSDFYHSALNDSKLISAKSRRELRVIIEREAIAWQVARASVKLIDEINILNANFYAMHEAIGALSVKPELLLIDGNRFSPYLGVPHRCIVKGDQKFSSIAAASILAKTHRDEYMEDLHQKYPEYQWSTNKGYATKQHRVALIEKGPSPYHRTSFVCKNLDLK